MKVTISIPIEIEVLCERRGMTKAATKKLYAEFIKHMTTEYYGDTLELFKKFYSETYA